MIITVFGATSVVGKEIVKLGLLLEHTIKAYGRNIHELIDDAEQYENLHLIKGAMFDKSDVAAAIKGSNVIISALEGASDGTDNTRSLGMKYIVAGMKKNEVSKIIAIGGVGVLQANEDQMLFEQENFPPELMPVTLEHLKTLDYLQQANVNWTFVCQSTIIENAADGKYTVSINYANTVHETISSGNVAQFMLNEALQNNYPNTKLALS